MKRLSLTWFVFLLIIGSHLHSADTLYIEPCDEVTINIFGDKICLSQDEGILRRYVKGKLLNIYSGQNPAGKFILQQPLRPILDGAGNIYMLDVASNTVIAWDRFLNIHSITPLHENILSPKDFTVTSEHDWLIYDDFYGQILQIHPGNSFYIDWGDKPVSGEVKIYAVEQQVIVFLEDQKLIRICDWDGTTLKEFNLPDNFLVDKLFPLNNMTFGLRSEDGVYIWKPEDAYLRYLSDLKDVVFLEFQANSYILISQEGAIVNIP
ncbi:MAG: hypothetical protein U9O95_02370 [Candidatus Marinimicrobia bacterium]|nr:hypothetical protein [Candidatus Neomarinimicrobiota bacterium]